MNKLIQEDNLGIFIFKFRRIQFFFREISIGKTCGLFGCCDDIVYESETYKMYYNRVSTTAAQLFHTIRHKDVAYRNGGLAKSFEEHFGLEKIGFSVC
jgi:hypothetical protein